MQRALQERPRPQPLDQQFEEQLDQHRQEIKAWKDGFFNGALAGFMLAFLVVFLVGPVAGFVLAFLLVFLAALWVKFCSRVRLTSPGPRQNDGKPRGIPKIGTGPRSGKEFESKLFADEKQTRNFAESKRDVQRRFSSANCVKSGAGSIDAQTITERCAVVVEAAENGLLDRSVAQGIVSLNGVRHSAKGQGTS